MNKLLFSLFSGAMKFFSIENEKIDILNSTELLRRRNIIVNRLLLVTNVLITIFIALYNEKISEGAAISLLIPSIGINILTFYFVFKEKDDYEKQLLGMYVAVLSVSFITLRLFYLYPQPYTYIFIYIALVIIALFQNRNAIILGDVLIFCVATFIHFKEMYEINLRAANGETAPSIISSVEKAGYDIFVYSMFLLLFIIIITAMVFFSEYLDKERKNELKKREELENEFENVLWNVFDTIEDFSQVTDDDELTSDYVSALMSRKLGQFLKFDEKHCEDLFSFAIVLGVNTDFNVSYDLEEKKNMIKDYSKIRYKLGVGSLLLKRTRIRIKCEGMVRSRYESLLISDNFKKIKAEDSSIENQIVLLTETYITLRDKQSYKKALPHAKAIKELSDTFNHFFDESLLNLFLENNVEFEAIYERTRC